MFRSGAACLVIASLLSLPGLASAQEPSRRLVAPSRAVAEAWAAEAREIDRRAAAERPSPGVLKTLFGSYGVLQGLDMYSTIVARNSGATELNPLMNGSYLQAVAFKAVMATTTLVSVKALEKKSRKAALITMISVNAVSAVVVTTNFRNAPRSRSH